MCTNLLGDVVRRSLSQLPHSHCFVGTDSEDGATIGGEAGVEDRRVVLVIDYNLIAMIDDDFRWNSNEVVINNKLNRAEEGINDSPCAFGNARTCC